MHSHRNTEALLSNLPLSAVTCFSFICLLLKQITGVKLHQNAALLEMIDFDSENVQKEDEMCSFKASVKQQQCSGAQP